MATITIKTGRDDYKSPGCRWIDLAFPDSIWEVDRVWKNAIEMHSVTTGTTMRASNHHGMTAPHWYPLTGSLFVRSHDLVCHNPVPGRPIDENKTIIKELADAVRASAGGGR